MVHMGRKLSSTSHNPLTFPGFALELEQSSSDFTLDEGDGEATISGTLVT